MDKIDPRCSECSQPFSVSTEDRHILDSLGLPTPQLCFEHALQRRLAFRNERHLYRRECEKCHTSVLAMFSPESYTHVYCRECWYSDSWNPMDYGRPYDPNRSFMEQWFEMVQTMPHYNLWKVGTNENSEYSNYAYNTRNSYLSFSDVESEGSLYNKNTDYCHDSADCYNVIKGELCYQCVDVSESYRCAYLTRAEKCADSYLGRDLQDCQNCFGCVNLKHKQFCWFNEQLTEQEYAKRLAAALHDRQSFTEQQKRFETFSQSQPVEFATIRASEDASGDYISHSSRIRNSFDIQKSENTGDTIRLLDVKDVYRESYTAWSQMCYENLSSPRRTNCIVTFACTDGAWVEYCFSCESCQNCFGNYGLRNKKCCILNTQYTEEEYKKLRAQIIEKMRQDGEWGEFFPIRMSPHAYNDTVAHEYYPLTQEQVEKNGWRWQGDHGGTRGKGTLQEIPVSIASTSPQITKEILTCQRCQLNYRIQPSELRLLQTLRLALPDLCPDCRFQDRFPRHRVPHSSSTLCSQCGTSILTSINPESGQKIYCNPCYQLILH